MASPRPQPPVVVLHFGGDSVRGTEMAAILAIEALQEAGHPVVLVANYPDLLVDHLAIPPAAVVQSDFPEIMYDGTLSLPLRAWWREFRMLRKVVRDARPIAIISSGGRPCQLGLPVGRTLGVPTIVHFHHPATRRFFYLWALRWADALIVPSRHTQSVVREKCGRESTLLPIGIDVDRYRPRGRDGAMRRGLGIAEDSVVIATVGALIPHKRLDLFIDAIATLAARGRPVRGLIIGDGPTRPELEDLIARRGLGSLILMTGRVPEIQPYLHQVADIHASTSAEEGFGLSVVEAAACGLPNVVLVAGALDEVVDDGIDGLVVPSSDAAAFADALDRLCVDPTARLRMGAAGMMKARTKYDVGPFKAGFMAAVRAGAGLDDLATGATLALASPGQTRAPVRPGTPPLPSVSQPRPTAGSSKPPES